MKLTQKVQYGVLFGLYLARAGRANSATVAGALSLPNAFLDQIARQLRQAGVVRSIRGPGGGYELIGNPTVGDVFKALDEKFLLVPDAALIHGSSEHRAFAGFITSVSAAYKRAANVTLRDVVLGAAQAEATRMENVSEASPN